MKEQELEEILLYDTSNNDKVILDRNPTLKNNILDALKAADNKGVTDSADSADLDVDTSGPGCYYSIDKQSILKNLIK